MTTSIDPQLIEDNLAVLRQGRALLDALDGAAYSRNAPTLALSGVGPHLRHVLDFYERFMSALEARAAGALDAAVVPDVDYDARDRDPRLETDPEHAAGALERMAARLGAVPTHAHGDDPLRIRSDGSGWIPSTVARELQSLVSHTVHHYALIAVAVRSHGGDPGSAFGVAPSTLRHWREQRRASEQPASAGTEPAAMNTEPAAGPSSASGDVCAR
ncbi:MAG: DinB family protein [Planctomycetota bacterium]